MTVLQQPAAGGVSATAAGASRRLSIERISLLVLLALTAVAYLWTLSESGYANDFYAAAAQAGSKSWKAWFFGSLDAGNAITVDKPPASLWVMGLSVRLFGLSSWSILVPQALMGVGTVALTFATVRRVATWHAGIVAGALAALTPAAVLMFRFDNPDALLLLLLVGAGYATLRATERGSWRWLVLAGVLVGFAFLTKMLQGFLPIPVLVLVYLLAAPVPLRRRLGHVALAAVAVIVSAGWFVAIVQLVPASARPYIDGSTNNSLLELVFGYNGFGRITGDEAGGHGNFGSSAGAGPLRMFQGVSGGMVTWYAPAALILLVAALVALRRAPRTDLRRAGLVLTAGCAIITGAVFSSMHGIYHDYYTVALAPWIAMAAVIGFAVLWPMRSALVWRLVLAAALLATAVWACVLLGQSGEQPYATLRWIVLVVGIAASGALVVADRITPRLAAGLLVVAALVTGLGPASYAIETIGTPHTGPIVTAGPYASGFGPGGGHGGMRGGPPGATGAAQGGLPGGSTQNAQNGRAGGFPAAGGQGGSTQGGPGGFAGVPGGQNGQNGQAGGFPGFGGPNGSGGKAGPGGGFGGMMSGQSVSKQVTAALQKDAGSYQWVLATGGSQSAATYELASGESVMALGGFNGNAPSISLKQFQAYVRAGKIHYYAAGRGGFGGGDRGSLAEMFAARGGFPGGLGQGGRQGFGGPSGAHGLNTPDNDISEIQSWVEKNFSETTIDGTTFYDLTRPKAAADADSAATSENGTNA